MGKDRSCWCGNTELNEFSADYLRCAVCETLVIARMPQRGDLLVRDDEHDLYGKHYFEQMEREYGLPSLQTRMRTDLPERCLYWLRGLLKYKLPPARVLELGSAHGGFVAMMRWAGFDAIGLDLSPSLVEGARQAFDVPMLTGCVESQDIAPHSIDAIVLMDVLEHLPDPLGTIHHCLKILKTDGVLFLQTPQYRELRTFEQMRQENDAFLAMFKPDHLYLFSKSSAQLLFQKLFVNHFNFEPAIFSQYDMAVVASRLPLQSFSDAEVVERLASRAPSRLSLALLDLDAQVRDLRHRHGEATRAYTAQSSAIEQLHVYLSESEADRAARLQSMMTLEKLLAESQAALAAMQETLESHASRLAGQQALNQNLNAQSDSLREQLATSEADRAARLQDMMTLEKLLAESQAALAVKQQELQANERRLADQEVVHQSLTARYDALREQLTAAEAALAAEQTVLEAYVDRHDELKEAYSHLAAHAREELAASESERRRLQAGISECEVERDRSAKLLDRVQHSYVYRLMRKVGLWSWLAPQPTPRIEAATTPAQTPKALRRVVVDLTPVLPGGENGGAKVMTLELIRHLSRITPECEFLLLTSKRSHEELAHLDGSSVRRICVDQPGGVLRASDNLAIRARRFLARFLPSTALEILSEAYQKLSEKDAPDGNLLRDLKADLLFCPFTAPFFFDPAVPVVSVVYDLQHVFYPQFFGAAELRERDRNLQRTIRVASRIVCISEYVRQTVLDHFKISPERVETIHIKAPHRLAEIQPADATILGSLGLQPDSYLLYPANFWPHKNHELLLTVFGQYHALNPGLDRKLVLTGAPGEGRERLIEASRRMGLSEHVVFPGYLPEDSFGALMNGCLAVIFPSLFEGFGMPLLEAMAAGKPVLCSNSTSLPEVAGGAALLFDPRKPAEMLDAITRVDQDPELRRVLRERGRQRVAAFGGPEEMSALYLKLFQEAVQAKTDLFPAVYGAFEDGWLREHGRISVGRGIAPRNLVLKLALPGWAPLDRISVRFASAAAPLDFEVSRGESKDVTVPLGPDSTVFEFACSPAFQPHAYGLGDDSRALTCQLKAAEIVDANGAVFKLESQMYAV